MRRKIRDNVGILAILLTFLSFCVGALEASPGFDEVAVRWTEVPVAVEDNIPWESDYPASLLPNEKININTATAADLERLPAIGAGRAEDIVNYRNQNGRFTEKEQLMDISGIGLGTLEQLQDYITLN